MKIFKCFIVGIVFISCSSSDTTIAGTYLSKKETKLDKLFNSYDYWAIGSTLNLEKDSTFFMKNCGNILEGRWKVKHDSLVLFINSNKFVIDSLNEISILKDQLKLNETKNSCFKMKNGIISKSIITTETNGDKAILFLKLKKQKF